MGAWGLRGPRGAAPARPTPLRGPRQAAPWKQRSLQAWAPRGDAAPEPGLGFTEAAAPPGQRVLELGWVWEPLSAPRLWPPHCLRGGWDPVEGSGGPSGQASSPWPIPSMAGGRTGASAQGASWGDRGAAWQSPWPPLSGPEARTQGAQGGDRRGRAGPAHAKRRMPTSPGPRDPGLGLDSRLQRCLLDRPRPEGPAGGTGPTVPRALPRGRMSTRGMGADRRPTLDWQLLPPVLEKRGPPSPLPCSLRPARPAQLGRCSRPRPSTGRGSPGHRSPQKSEIVVIWNLCFNEFHGVILILSCAGFS